MIKIQRLVILPIIMILISLACGGGTNPSQESTLEAISNQVSLTGTAAALEKEQSNTADQSAAATQTALALMGPALTATAEAAYGPILAELPKYGVDPTSGQMAWVHPPVSLEVEGFMNFDYVNHFISTLAQDFVISADITWDAIGSESSCGFAIRSDGNEDAMDTYLATISRVASGHFIFLTIAKGEAVTGQDIYAKGRDPVFDWQNNATNNLTVVGRGNRFWIYTNGTLIGEIDPSAPPVLVLPPEPQRTPGMSDAEFMLEQASYEQEVALVRAEYNARLNALKNADTTFDRGFMAMVALSRAGKKATCQFENAWLWLIE